MKRKRTIKLLFLSMLSISLLAIAAAAEEKKTQKRAVEQTFRIRLLHPVPIVRPTAWKNK